MSSDLRLCEGGETGFLSLRVKSCAYPGREQEIDLGTSCLKSSGVFFICRSVSITVFFVTVKNN